jgi:protein-disulfide isomerase-like protein with CxxC motif
MVCSNWLTAGDVNPTMGCAMREDQIDQAERREILDNDLKVLQQQGSTFHQHAGTN